MTKAKSWSEKHVKWGLKLGGKAAWIVCTTALVTLFPLLLEVQREQQIIERETFQVGGGGVDAVVVHVVRNWCFTWLFSC